MFGGTKVETPTAHGGLKEKQEEEMEGGEMKEGEREDEGIRKGRKERERLEKNK